MDDASPGAPLDCGSDAPRYRRCPKCGHPNLPLDQRLPVACPACGLILAKAAQAARTARHPPRPAVPSARPRSGWGPLLRGAPGRADPLALWGRALLFAGFAAWGLQLATLDYRNGEIFMSFLHGPLLVFHEAGHVLFRIGGSWLMVAGGTLGQLLMPTLLAAALLLKNRDAFGAAIGLWLLGVSLLDVAPYVYDALDPRLTLLNGETGEAGGHDWIYLLSSMGLRQRAHGLGAAVHALGTAVELLALVWAGWVLRAHWRRRAPRPSPR
jgi:hypothetical protein